MINVFMPPEELGSAETIKSFQLLPWTDDHPGTLLGAKADGLVPAEEKGVHGVIGQDVYFKDGTLFGNLKVFSEDLAREIASGKRELSCGYRCDFIPQEGVFNGKRYQYVQRNVRGNHTASVMQGRRGPGIRVMDAAERYLTFSLDMREPIRPATPAEEIDVPIEQTIRDVRRDFAAKERLARGLSSIGFAHDDVEVARDVIEIETAKEFAARMLQNIGLPAAADPIMALDMYIRGHGRPEAPPMTTRENYARGRGPGGGRALDSTSLMGRYLSGQNGSSQGSNSSARQAISDKFLNDQSGSAQDAQDAHRSASGTTTLAEMLEIIKGQ
jgi:hypothetical protein